ncbi:PREDICTED: uncharacterized protein LOC106742118 [Dinoponera quadriceps]|uniref:Uncharacterized protein LOC106742118 n=1 Tax=Dinoponera quadriceps TaxID=609295 RepID=A0A6P3WVQ9_DINQU|nr:PREDICTED: uncharacterized protein LOC106742118 [Dinoponera quadriceps]
MRIIFALLVVTSDLVTEKSFSYDARSGQTSMLQLPRCDRYSMYLTKCIENLLLMMRPYFATGIPELNIPPFQPFQTDYFDFTLHNADFRGYAVFRQIKLFGLSNYQVESVEVFSGMREIKFQTYIPLSTLRAIYSINATISGIYIDRHGYQMRSTLSGISSNVHIIGDYRRINNEDRFVASNVFVKLSFIHVIFQPEFIVCNRTQKNIETCIEKSIQSMRPYLKNGIRMLNISSIDPFRAEHFQFTSNKSFSGIAKCESLEMDNFSKFTVINVEYEFKGNFIGAVAKVTINGEFCTSDSNHEEFFNVRDVSVILSIRSVTSHIKNLVEQDAILDEVNSYLNSDWGQIEIRKEILPEFQRAAATVIRSIANKIYSTYPIELLMPKI